MWRCRRPHDKRTTRGRITHRAPLLPPRHSRWITKGNVMKKDAVIVALMLASTAPTIAAPGLILADVTPNNVAVGDTLTVTMRISGYSDTIEIDGFAFD